MRTSRRGVGAYRWELGLVGVTAVWGSTFVLVRDAVARVPPFAFIAYRFLAAALLVAAIRPRLAAAGRPELAAAGAVAGLALFAGYGFQTVGLQYTTASNAGFITGLTIVNSCYTSFDIIEREEQAHDQASCHLLPDQPGPDRRRGQGRGPGTRLPRSG